MRRPETSRPRPGNERRAALRRLRNARHRGPHAYVPPRDEYRPERRNMHAREMARNLKR
jgi:hypothetical protein